MPSVRFFSEDIQFIPAGKNKLKNWIRTIVGKEGSRRIGSINYIFCSDACLYRLNKEYLGHRNLTDIITFDHSDSEELIDADIYISVERVHENSQNLKINPKEELNRVIIHGILHLLGYKDKSEEERKYMRQKENECLNLLN